MTSRKKQTEKTQNTKFLVPTSKNINITVLMAVCYWLKIGTPVSSSASPNSEPTGLILSFPLYPSFYVSPLFISFFLSLHCFSLSIPLSFIRSPILSPSPSLSLFLSVSLSLYLSLSLSQHHSEQRKRQKAFTHLLSTVSDY